MSELRLGWGGILGYSDDLCASPTTRRKTRADLDWGAAFILKDDRRDYGEDRYRVLGKIGERLYAVVFTPKEDEIRVISFRRANRREEVLYDRARESERGR
jgi:uncharacterized DUF497 family protein